MEQNVHTGQFDAQTESVETMPTESAEFIEIRLLDKIETIENKAVSR
ncbi:hypothetical protein [Streptomyces sp. NPDC002845]